MSLHSSIIQLLLKNPTSLADLQQATHSSLPTIRKNVQELVEARYIRVVGQAEANSGRPAMLFGMDDQYYMIIGLHLQLPGVRLITIDLAGGILDELKLFDAVVPTPAEIISAVIEYLNHVRKRFPDRPILGIGIASPGFIDPSTGDIITIIRVPSWGSFPFCKQLSAAAKLPVHIANDVDCMAFAEFDYINLSPNDNIIYVGFDDGVKISMFLYGKLYKGSLGNAGLISSSLLRVKEQPDSQMVHSLLSIIGVNRLLERQVRQLEIAEQERYAHWLAISNPRERFEVFIKNPSQELPVCQHTMQEMIEVLSAAVAALIHIVQPDMVIIGGLLSSMSDEWFSHLEKAIRDYLPPLINNNSIIQKGKTDSKNSAAIGATKHFMQDYLNDLVVM
ncbi:MAG: ROK family transcriptional regulator [Anaerolineales bacterium]|nr:ROK family transcriptional regulator [Anaerolineales bacterium]